MARDVNDVVVVNETKTTSRMSSSIVASYGGRRSVTWSRAVFRRRRRHCRPRVVMARVGVTGDGAPPAKRRKGASGGAASLPSSFASGGRARTVASIARASSLSERHVRAAVALLDDECTVPFIARYRKEATGGMDENALRDVAARLADLDRLESRRDAILSALDKSGSLHPSLERAVRAADTHTALEDLYLPHRPKRATRAAAAVARGLEPLADALLDPRGCPPGGPRALARSRFLTRDVPAVDDALRGARDIIAERAAEIPAAREAAREAIRRGGRLTCARVPEKTTRRAAASDASARAAARSRAKASDAAREYFDFTRDVRAMQPHQTLAVERAESAGVLRVSLAFDLGSATRAATRALLPSKVPRAQFDEAEAAVADGVKRLLAPAVEREARATLREAARRRAVVDFGANLRALLSAPPMRPAATVVGVDPAYRTGCKLAAVDPTGAVLGVDVVHLPEVRGGVRKSGEDDAKRGRGAGSRGGGDGSSSSSSAAAFAKFLSFCRRHGATAVAIGDGVGTREAERLVASAVASSDVPIGWRVVSEAGASVYSASPLAASELPDLDVSRRGAVSIARRLQDPMAELVKIDPQSLGVGLYQHDVAGKELARELDEVVRSAVAAAGVNLNTASASLLSRVPGFNARVAADVAARRDALGAFRRRAELLDVRGIGPKTFQQAAGFLRVDGAEDALERTGVHPESVDVARAAVAAALELASDAKTKSSDEVVVIDDEDLDDDVVIVRETTTTGSDANANALEKSSSSSSSDRKKRPREGSNPRASTTSAEDVRRARPGVLRLLGDDAALASLADRLGAGPLDLRGVLQALAVTSADDRPAADAGSLLRTSATDAKDLVPGRVVAGQIRNVVPFGAFVDVGVGVSGLLHRSKMRLKGGVEPHAAFRAGQAVRVRVETVDAERGRISLGLADESRTEWTKKGGRGSSAG